MKGGRHGTAWPPERLRPVPRRLRRIVWALWLAMLAAALVATAGGLWRGVVQATVIDIAFAEAGLVTGWDEDDRLTVGPATAATTRAGIRPGSRFVAVNGEPLPVEAGEEVIARRLTAKPGKVSVTLKGPDGRFATHRLARGPKVKAEALGPLTPLGVFLFLTSFGLVGTVALLVAAILLIRRRPDDPVAVLLSFSFVAALSALVLPQLFWDWAGIDWMISVAGSVWLGLLVAVLPAFPNGRFEPRWGGWLAVLALPFAVLTMLEDQLGDWTTLIAFAGALLAIACPILRYRRLEPGLEKQQLKWAAFGFVASILVLMGAFAAVFVGEAFALPGGWQLVPGVLALALLNLCFLLLPLGVLVSLLRYRLWVADKAIGQSAGFAAITLVMGTAGAASSSLFDAILSDQLAGAGEPVAAAVGTLMAALVFGPVRGRVDGWVERRFQRGVVALKALPARLQVWQHGERPEEVGTRVAAAIAEALHAAHAALLVHDGEAYRLLAAHGITPETIAEWLAGHQGTPAASPRDPLFPLTVTLDDLGVPVGALLLGRRSDGSLYSRDETAALEALEVPLAATLRQAQRRAVRDEALEALFTRIAALEREVEALRPRPDQSRQ
jgi:hypothetical protein